MVAIENEVSVAYLNQFDRRQRHTFVSGSGNAYPAIARVDVAGMKVGIEIVMTSPTASNLVNGHGTKAGIVARSHFGRVGYFVQILQAVVTAG